MLNVFFRSRSDTVAAIEVVVGFVVCSLYALAGYDSALVLLLVGLGLVPGWMTFRLIHAHPLSPLRSWEKSRWGATLLLLLLQLYLGVAVAIGYMFWQLLENSVLIYSVLGFLGGVFFAAFFRLGSVLSSYPWDPMENVQEGEISARERTLKLVALVAGGVVLSFVTLIPAAYVLLEYVVGPLIRYFAQ